MHDVEIHERHQDRSGNNWITDIEGDEQIVTIRQRCGELISAVTIDVSKLLELNRQLKIAYQPASGQYVILRQQFDEVNAWLRDNMREVYDLLDSEETEPIVRTMASYVLASIVTGEETDGTRRS